MRNTLLSSLLALASGLLASCSGDELVGLHIDLAKDGSGTLTTRSLVELADATEAQGRTAGVDWKLSAALVSSQGTFKSLAALQIADGEVKFTPEPGSDRIRVEIARGKEARWISALVPDELGRQRMAKAYDPSGRTREIADVLRIELRVPGRVVTSGVLPTGRGVTPDRDGKRAILLLPVRTAREEGDPFVWDISWLED